MTSTTTTPQRGVLASFAFLLISMLSAQALAHYNCASLGLQCFNEGPLSYSITSGTTVEVRCSGQVGRGCGGSGKKDIVIPATVKHKGTTYSVTAIGRYGLSISGLTSVIIPDSVTTIGEEAFQGNFLTSVIIPDSVTSIGEEAFFRNALNSVLIPDGVTTIGRKTFSENALTSVIIPDSVTTIGNGAFGDNALTSVTIPDSVTTIGNFAFYNNVLTSVIIPDSVEAIGLGTFGLNALISAVFEGNFGGFELDMFEYNADLATITYAQGASGWDAPLRVFMPDTGPTGSVTAEAAVPAATPVPTGPLWLLGIMAGLLSLVGISKLRKA